LNGSSMLELSRYIFLAGALPFVTLGIMHAQLAPRGLSPRDPALRDAMMRGFPVLTRRVTIWRGWVGFNFTHSLGLVLFGVAVLLIGRSSASFQSQAAIFIPFAIVVSAIYLALAIRYFFRTPILGIALSCLCFVASWVVSLVS
jgi:hypothetical protein